MFEPEWKSLASREDYQSLSPDQRAFVQQKWLEQKTQGREDYQALTPQQQETVKAGTFGEDYNPSFWPGYEGPKVSQEPSPVQNSDQGFWGSAVSAVTGGMLDAADTVARGFRAIPGGEAAGQDQSGAASGILEKLNALRRAVPGLRRQEKEGGFASSLYEGARSAVTSIAAGLPGAAAGAAAGSVVGPVGTIIGGITGFALSGGTLFGLSEYDRAMEEGIVHNQQNPDRAISREDLEHMALWSAIAEGGFEFVTDLIEGATFKLGATLTAPTKLTLKEGLKKIIGTNVKQIAGRMGTIAAVETGFEMATAATQTELRNRIGMSDQRVWDAAAEAFGPALVASIIFGGIAEGGAFAVRRSTTKALQSPDVNDEERFRVINQVYDQIKAVDPDLASVWAANANRAVAMGETIPIDDDIANLKMFKSEAEQDVAAAQRLVFDETLPLDQREAANQRLQAAIGELSEIRRREEMELRRADRRDLTPLEQEAELQAIEAARQPGGREYVRAARTADDMQTPSQQAESHAVREYNRQKTRDAFAGKIKAPRIAREMEGVMESLPDSVFEDDTASARVGNLMGRLATLKNRESVLKSRLKSSGASPEIVQELRTVQDTVRRVTGNINTIAERSAHDFEAQAQAERQQGYNEVGAEIDQAREAKSLERSLRDQPAPEGDDTLLTARQEAEREAQLERQRGYNEIGEEIDQIKEARNQDQDFQRFRELYRGNEIEGMDEAQAYDRYRAFVGQADDISGIDDSIDTPEPMRLPENSELWDGEKSREVPKSKEEFQRVINGMVATEEERAKLLDDLDSLEDRNFLDPEYRRQLAERLNVVPSRSPFPAGSKNIDPTRYRRTDVVGRGKKVGPMPVDQITGPLGAPKKSATAGAREESKQASGGRRIALNRQSPNAIEERFRAWRDMEDGILAGAPDAHVPNGPMELLNPRTTPHRQSPGEAPRKAGKAVYPGETAQEAQRPQKDTDSEPKPSHDKADTSTDEQAAAWWDGTLTPAGRREVMRDAGIKLPDRTLWRHISKAQKKMLLAVKAAAEQEGTSMPPGDPSDATVTVSPGTRIETDKTDSVGNAIDIVDTAPTQPKKVESAMVGEESTRADTKRDVESGENIAVEKLTKKSEIVSRKEPANGRNTERDNRRAERKPVVSGPALVGDGISAEPGAGALEGGAGGPAQLPAGVRKDRGIGDVQSPEGRETGGRPDPGSGSRSGRTDKPGSGTRTDARRSGRRDTGVGRDDLAPEDQNHVIAPSDKIIPGGAESKIQANIGAIRLLRKLQAEDRNPTPAEKKNLAQYTGWGAFSEKVFNRTFSKALKAAKETTFPDLTRVLSKSEHEDYLRWREKYGRHLHPKLGGMLTQEEWDSAAASTMNAHYTAREVIDAMWSVVRHLGFKGGNVLEPAGGVSHFFGLMPTDIASGSMLHGVELDTISGNIFQKLYPQANIQVTGFQNARGLDDNSMDLVISNVPFGNYPIIDKTHKHISGWSIHNYFLARGMDTLRPGGLMVTVTSRYSMDSTRNTQVREYLGAQGDLVGAIRLPRDAFMENAGTEVVTDILIFRKKDSDRVGLGQDFRMSVPVEIVAGKPPVNINTYFADHPDMVMGVNSLAGSMYSAEEYTVESSKVGDLKSQIAKATQGLPSNIAGEGADISQAVRQQWADEGQRDDTLVYGSDGEPMLVLNGKLVEPSYPDSKGNPAFPMRKPALAERVRQYMKVREAAKELIKAMRDEATTDAQIADMQATLNAEYDAFTKRFKAFNATYNQFLRKLDAEYPIVDALEDVHRETVEVIANGKPDAKEVVTISKAPIFERRTIFPFKEPNTAETIEDALVLSRIYRGAIDAGYISTILDRPVEAVRTDIVQAGLGFLDPKTGRVVERDKYLSGDVKTKLEEAIEAAKTDKAFESNIDALMEVQPVDLPISQITFMLGSDWIPADCIADFLREELDVRATVNRSEAAGRSSFKITNVEGAQNPKNVSTWGTDRIKGHELIQKALSLSKPVIKDSVDDGVSTRSVVNQEATQAAERMQERINARFIEWAKTHSKWADALAEKYNATKNRFTLRKFDVPQIKHYPGATQDLELNPHQKRAVSRVLQESCLLAYGVGTGKTFIYITAAMEMRRIGTARKPCIVVHNSTVEQYRREFQRLYPGSKVLIPNWQQRNAKSRKKTLSQIATGDWDAIVLPQSFFDGLANDPRREAAYIQEEIAELEATIDEIKDEEGANSYTVKDMEKAKARKEARLESLMDGTRDDALVFEELGIDALLVDEAHAYKRGEFSTKMNKVRGISSDASKKATSTLLKTRYVLEKTGGKNVIFATGTPISNTMAEAWILLRYIRPDLMNAFHVGHFDAFATAFGQVVDNFEETAAGTWKNIKRFSKYINGPELLKMFHSFTDVMLTQSANLKLPNIIGGAPQAVVVKQDDELKNFIAGIRREYQRFENMTGKEKRANRHIPLVLYTLAKKAAIDLRLVDPGYYADRTGGKLDMAAQKIHEIWEDTKENRLSQVVFLDIFRNGPSGTFDAYKELTRMLEEKGIPAKDILSIQDAKNDKQREIFFEKIRSGKARIIMGSTEKLGVGVDFAQRMVAAHHLDVPPRPMDLEQRNGRIVRQSNGLKNVHIFNYVTENTLDSKSFSVLATKQKFIDQMLTGKIEGRSFDDPFTEDLGNINDLLSAASGMAGQLHKERNRLLKERKDLRMDEEASIERQSRARRTLNNSARIIENIEKNIVEADKASAKVRDEFPDLKFERLTIDGKEYERTEAYKVIRENPKAYSEQIYSKFNGRQWTSKSDADYSKIKKAAPDPIHARSGGLNLEIQVRPKDSSILERDEKGNSFFSFNSPEDTVSYRIGVTYGKAETITELHRATQDINRFLIRIAEAPNELRKNLNRQQDVIAENEKILKEPRFDHKQIEEVSQKIRDVENELMSLQEDTQEEDLGFSALPGFSGIRVEDEEEGEGAAEDEGGHVEDGEVPQYSVAARTREKITLADVRRAVGRGLNVRQADDGRFLISGQAAVRPLELQIVDHIPINADAFRRAYQREPSSEEMQRGASGVYRDGKIQISAQGDQFTIDHEFTHALIEARIISFADLRAILKSAGIDPSKIRRSNVRDYEEQIAAHVEAVRMKKAAPKGMTRVAIQKIIDFIDRLVNLVHRTARGVVRDIESGRIFDRPGEGSMTFQQGETYSIRGIQDEVVDTIGAAGRAARNFSPRAGGWLDNLLSTAEWAQTKVGKAVFKARMAWNDYRQKLFHEADARVSNKERSLYQDLLAIRNKGIGFFGRMSSTEMQDVQNASNVSPLYKEVARVIRDMDVNEIKWSQYDKTGLDPQVVSIVSDYRAAMDRLWEYQYNAIGEIVQAYAEKGKELPELYKDPVTKQSVTLKDLYDEMGKLKGTYAPRIWDDGDFEVWSKDRDGQLWLHKATTKAGAYKIGRGLERKGHSNIEYGESVKFSEELWADLSIGPTAKLLESAAGKMDIDPDVAVEAKKALLEEAAIAFKERAFRKHRLVRSQRGGKEVRGYIEDPLARYLIYATRTAGGIAKSNAALEMFKALNGEYRKFERDGDEWVYTGPDGTRHTRKVSEEDKKTAKTTASFRVGGLDPKNPKDRAEYDKWYRYIKEQMKNPSQVDRIIAMGKALVSMKYLSSPKSAIINTTSVLTNAPAAVRQYATGAKAGFAEVGSALARAGKDYARIMGGEKLANRREQAFMDRIRNETIDRPQFMRDAMGAIRTAQGTAFAKTMDLILKPFSITEQWNRGTTLLAAYRMALKHNPGLSDAELQDMAIDATMKAHGIYDRATDPMWAMGDNPAAHIAKMGYTYQKYGHNWIQMMADLGFRKGDVKGALWLAAAPMVLGGTTGSIAMIGIMPLVAAFLKAGGDDRDPEKWFYDTLREIVGNDGEKVARYGAFGALGMDMSGSLGLHIGAPRSLKDLTGPFGGVWGDVETAGDYLRSNQYGRAAEVLAPNLLRNTLAAIRELDGAVTTKGRRVWDDKGRPYVPGGYETVLKAIGARSANRALLQTRAWEERREGERFRNQRDIVYDMLRADIYRPDPERRRKVFERIRRYNQALVDNGLAGKIPFITRQSIRKQYRLMSRPSQ